MIQLSKTKEKLFTTIQRNNIKIMRHCEDFIYYILTRLHGIDFLYL